MNQIQFVFQSSNIRETGFFFNHWILTHFSNKKKTMTIKTMATTMTTLMRTTIATKYQFSWDDQISKKVPLPDTKYRLAIKGYNELFQIYLILFGFSFDKRKSINKNGRALDKCKIKC